MRNKKLIVIFSVVLFLTLLIVLNSVIFSVQHVNAYCMSPITESEAEVLEAKVVGAAGIKKGRSIFTMSKKNATKRIHSSAQTPNVKVINIEKKFPNTVYINFIKVEEYYRVTDGNRVLYVSNERKILSVLEDKQQEPPQRKHITFISAGTVKPGLTVGDYLETDRKSDETAFGIINDAISLYGERQDLIQMFEFIDISKSNYIYFKTESGVYIEIAGLSDAAQKLRKGISQYKKYLLEDLQKTTRGTIIITNPAPDAIFSYSERNRYLDGIN